MDVTPYLGVFGEWIGIVVKLIGGIAGILFWNLLAHRRHERRMEELEWMKVKLLYLIEQNTRRR